MTRYAVVKIGSHQYYVEEKSVLEVEKLAPSILGSQDAKEVKLSEVLLVQDNGKPKVGQPFVPKAFVTCEVLGETKLPKAISFKFKRRKGYHKKIGHRQTVLRLRVKSIQSG